MPEVSRFVGIVIAMYHDEHPPPHFPARYAGKEIQVAIGDGSVCEGVRVNPDIGTIVWPNGADVAPETLYERVQVAG